MQRAAQREWRGQGRRLVVFVGNMPVRWCVVGASGCLGEAEQRSQARGERDDEVQMMQRKETRGRPGRTAGMWAEGDFAKKAPAMGETDGDEAG